ncbi:TetR/AcrR family transcriptional regulator [Roseicyclus sp. F158]|uniref:TetR/AcrR family transcriptional regulator n=1 Tax=Tropicimonas omnivorans TaxID=3075590 RepID=A0ABU3DI90_9RHOB|nr:TetR/AcrR family transcriptional regulator [Roseicyclus sp. F158]MDT0683446.1 TetR/AcrR family transcriptional regulator [Roseicyclus sp. F158]
MPTQPLTALKPRKTPSQSRSRVTVDAIYEATIQVLLSRGMAGLTTTGVAERAGVSVGTMYQYFPNKQSLVYALNERFLTTLAERVEATCAQMQGRSIAEAAEALVDTYWAAKTERPELTRALYRSVAELETDALLRAFAARVDKATTDMFCRASDFRSPDAGEVNLLLTTVIYGSVRNAFERGLGQEEIAGLKSGLKAMCRAYLEAVGN